MTAILKIDRKSFQKTESHPDHYERLPLRRPEVYTADQDDPVENRIPKAYHWKKR
jgi:hypothetical protein